MSGTFHEIYGALPWHTSEDASGRVFARNGEKIARVEFFQGEAKKMIKREEAIARLLAAAPAMVAALGVALAFLERTAHEEPGDRLRAADIVRAAVKAAQ